MRMRKESFLAIGELGAVTFHCVSRVVDRAYKLGDREKAMFVRFMREYELFFGLEVMSYAIMSNHFHLLVRVPKASDEEISDEVFIERLRAVYKPIEVQVVADQLKKCRKNDANKMARDLKAQYTYRMGNISEFMKSLKQKFTRWFNKTHARTGTLWEQRYGVTFVGPGWSTQVVAAYIDLNPLRAGIVSDPSDYKFSSYGEACGGEGRARTGLFKVMLSEEEGASRKSNAPKDEKEALAQYRMLLAEEGISEESDGQPMLGQSQEQVKKKSKGFSKAEVKEILKKNGELSLAQLLRCKTRYFSAGFAVGSKRYMDTILSCFGKAGGQLEDRVSGSVRFKHGKHLGMHSLRNLTKKLF
jgi:putative transposase